MLAIASTSADLVDAGILTVYSNGKHFANSRPREEQRNSNAYQCRSPTLISMEIGGSHSPRIHVQAAQEERLFKAKPVN